MNPPRFEEAIRAAATALSAIPDIRGVILFGSAAMDAAEEDSDIDLLILGDERVRDPATEVLNGLDRDHHVHFSSLFYRDREEFGRADKQFLESLLRHGKPLLGELPQFGPRHLDLEPLRLVSYWTSDLTPPKRARLLRELDGYRTRKKVRRKVYTVDKPGFLKGVGGWRVGRGAVVVPEAAAKPLEQLLRRHGAKRILVPIWSQRP